MEKQPTKLELAKDALNRANYPLLVVILFALKSLFLGGSWVDLGILTACGAMHTYLFRWRMNMHSSPSQALIKKMGELENRMNNLSIAAAVKRDTSKRHF